MRLLMFSLKLVHESKRGDIEIASFHYYVGLGGNAPTSWHDRSQFNPNFVHRDIDLCGTIPRDDTQRCHY